jgi:chromosomal replication initiator protein
MSKSKLWNDVLKEANTYLTDQIIETWLKPLKIGELDGKNLVLIAPNKFYKIWIEQNYLNTLEKVLSEKFSISSSISIDYDNTHINKKITERSEHLQDHGVNKLKGYKTNLNKQYIFDNFVVGNSNQFAYTACLSVADGNFHTYNPLYIYGGVGLGKTHLLHAVGNKILDKMPKLKILYIPSEQFTNEMIKALRVNKMDDFREKYRTIDILLFDDAQFLSGKERTTEEFFYTFNTLYDSQKQIIITCDKSPAELSSMEERITSRFSWGLIADIQPPSVEEKTAIILKIAGIRDIYIGNDIAMYLAENIKSNNNRELIGSLIRLSAYSKFKNKPISVDLIHECLEDYLMSKDKIVTVDDIIKVVCNYFNIKVYNLKSRKRTKSISFPRNIAIYLLREKLNISLQEIGDIFGGRDHATILYSIKVIKNKIKTDQEVKEMINTLLKELYK